MAAKQKQGKGSGKTPKHSPSDMTQAQRTAHNKQRKLEKAAAAKCNAAAKRLRAEYMHTLRMQKLEHVIKQAGVYLARHVDDDECIVRRFDDN